LRFNEVEDPEAFAFFSKRRNPKTDRLAYFSSCPNKPKIILSTPESNKILKGSKISVNEQYKSIIASKTNNPGKCLISQEASGKVICTNKCNKGNYANMTASKFRSENLIRSFYEEEFKNDKVKGNSSNNTNVNNKKKSNSNIKEKDLKSNNNKNNTNIKKNILNNNNYNERQNIKNNDISDDEKSEFSAIPIQKPARGSEIHLLNSFNKTKSKNNNTSNKKAKKYEEYDYENVDTPTDKKQLKGIDTNEKVLSTINLISKNRKNFKETNKILKEIGNFYKEKKDIFMNFHDDENENESDEKLKNYLREYQKIKKENRQIDERIEKLSSKGSSLHDKISRKHNEIKKSQNSLMKGTHI